MKNRKFLNLISVAMLAALMLTMLCTTVVFAAEERTVLGATGPADGTSSALITGETVCWVREEFDGHFAWYGIDNVSGVFAEGSKFWVRTLTMDSDPREFDENISIFDSLRPSDASHAKKLLLFGVTDPDGNEYTQLSTKTTLYVQLSDEWDAESLKAIVSDGKRDEIVPIQYREIECPEGRSRFMQLTLSHLGTPLVILEGCSLFASMFSQYQPFVTIALFLVIVVVAICIVVRKKKADAARK